MEDGENGHSGLSRCAWKSVRLLETSSLRGGWRTLRTGSGRRSGSTDEHHRLALINIPGLPVRDPDAVGTDHVAHAYNNLGELFVIAAQSSKLSP